MVRNSKRAIFFDFGDTVASTIPLYLVRIATAMRASGCPVSDREFEIAYIKTDYEIYKRYKTKGKITPYEYGEWFFPILCRYLSLDGDPYAIRARMREALKEIRFVRFALPGAVEILEFLKEKGFLLGIISNNDGRTEEKCDEAGIREYFNIIADSTKVGLTKPDSRIFQFVLEKLKLSPYEAIHIGDLYGSDVLGGLNAGLDVLWLNKSEIDGPDGTQVTSVKNLSEIQTILDTEKAGSEHA